MQPRRAVVRTFLAGVLTATTLAVLAPPTGAVDRRFTGEVYVEYEGPADAGPYAMAVADDGTVYLPVFEEYDPDQATTGLVRAFHPDGTTTDTDWTFDYVPNFGPEGFPSDLALDDAGNLYGYVDFPYGSAEQFHEDGTILAPQVLRLAPGADAPETLPIDLTRPNYYINLRGIGVTGDGDVLVPEYPTDGATLSSVLRLEAGASQAAVLPALPFSVYPSDLAEASDGRTYVSDYDGDLYELIDGTASWQLRAEVNGNSQPWHRLTVADDGTPYVQKSGALVSADPVTGEVSTATAPSGWTVDSAQGVLYVLDFEGKVLRLSERGVVIAADVSASTPTDSPVDIELIANDTLDEPITYEYTQPQHGTVTGEGAQVTYTPEAEYAGPDTFTFTASNDSGSSATATVTVHVLGQPSEGFARTVLRDYPTSYSILGLTTDAAGTAYVSEWDSPAASGTAVRGYRSDGTSYDLPWTWTKRYGGLPDGLPIARFASDDEGNLTGFAPWYHLPEDPADYDPYPPGKFYASPNTATFLRLDAGGDSLRTLPFTGGPNSEFDFEHRAFAVTPEGDVYLGAIGQDIFGANPPPDMVATSELRVIRAGTNVEELLGIEMSPFDALAAGRDGTLYSYGAYTGKISKLNFNTGTWSEIAAVNQGGFELYSGGLTSLAIDERGHLFVLGTVSSTPRRSVIREFDETGTFVRDIRSGHNTEGSVVWFTRSPNGSLHVIEDSNSGQRLVRLDPVATTTVTATDASWTVAADRSTTVVLSAVDSADGPLTFALDSPPAHGTVTGDGPTVSYTPEPGYTGPDSFTFTAMNAEGQHATATVNLTVAAGATTAVEQQAPPGGTVTTGTETTASEPQHVGVTTPVAGTVSITQTVDPEAPEGYSVVGTQYDIEAPTASVAEPLELRFLIATSTLPSGTSPEDVSVFRDGVLLADCASTDGTAEPDPCVASRTVAGGTLTITALTSHASVWTMAVQQRDTTTSLVAQPNPGAVEQIVELTATVRQGELPVSGGLVEFREGDTVLGSAPVLADGTAALNHDEFLFGDHQVTAHYLGDGLYLPSSSTPTTVQITERVATKLDAAPVLLRTGPGLTLNVTLGKLTARLTRAESGAGVSGVPVEFRAAGRLLCKATTGVDGTASCTGGPTLLPVLTFGYTASFAGDGRYEPASGTGKLIR